MLVVSRKKIKEVIFLALESFNASQDTDNQVPIDESTVLIGRHSVVDSIGLVSLVIEIEQQIGEQLDLSISLTSEKAMSLRVSPFRRIKTLIDFVVQELSEDDQ